MQEKTPIIAYYSLWTAQKCHLLANAEQIYLLHDSQLTHYDSQNCLMVFQVCNLLSTQFSL